VGGERVTTERVSLKGGERRTIRFRIQVAEGGRVAVDGVTGGEFTLGTVSDSGENGGLFESLFDQGFGVYVAVVAVVSVVLLAIPYRRNAR
jgi:hypothetical protein